MTSFARATLSLRDPAHPSDLILDPEDILRPLEWPRSGTVLLLVHGFNVGMAKAETGYSEYLANLEAVAAPSTPGFTLVCDVLWPGDHPNPVISVESFPVRIPVAARAGAHLAEFLAANPGPRIVIVAHSLGCVLTLEALRHISRVAARVEISHVFLMAAAVPEDYCRGSRQFSQTRITISTRQIVLYSANDLVLSSVFQGGWHRYQPGPGEAVGRYGAPIRRWDSRASLRTSIGHKHYWSAPETAAFAADVLGLAADRIPEAVSSALTAVQPRETWPTENEIREARPGER
jgi:hypothetical protein